MIWKEGREAGRGVGLQTGVESRHTAGGPSQMWPADLQPRTPPYEEGLVVGGQEAVCRVREGLFV